MQCSAAMRCGVTVFVVWCDMMRSGVVWCGVCDMWYGIASGDKEKRRVRVPLSSLSPIRPSDRPSIHPPVCPSVASIAASLPLAPYPHAPPPNNPHTHAPTLRFSLLPPSASPRGVRGERVERVGMRMEGASDEKDG